MSITTYAELKSAIADFLNRDDLTSVIPTFISLAEASINRDLRHWRQEKRVEATLDEQYENFPVDFLEIQELSLTDGTRLEMVSTAFMQERKQESTAAGKPRYFRVYADQFEFYPAPDASYTMSMQYYARTPALSDTNTSNWILTYAPDAYLYGALAQAAPYLAEDGRITIWASLYQNAIEGMRLDGERGKYSGPLKMGVPR